MTGTCTCRLSAVAVKLITFQCFDKFQVAIFSIISAFADSLCAERQMNMNYFGGNFSAFNFRFGD